MRGTGRIAGSDGSEVPIRRQDRIGRSAADTRLRLGGWGPITQQRKPDPIMVGTDF